MSARLNAGVAIFCYDRVDKLEGLLASLSLCDGFNPQDLWVFHDGCGSKSNFGHKAVRDYLKSKPSQLGGANVILRDANFGLRDNIVDGINRVLSAHESVVVLEDDLILHKDFLRFMKIYLQAFWSDENIFSINGYVPRGFESTTPFFSSTFNCWGWGTWRSRWQYANLCDDIERHILFDELREYCDYYSGNHWSQIYLNKVGRKKTWAINTQLKVWAEQKRCVYPPFSLVENAGNDNSGENSWSHMQEGSKLTRNRLVAENLEFNKEMQVKTMHFPQSVFKRVLFGYLGSYRALLLLSALVYQPQIISLVKKLKLLQGSIMNVMNRN